jgi:hypothetical protein
MLRPQHLAPALSVALALLLATGACTLDADTTQDQTGPTVATDAQPSKAATSVAKRVDDGTGAGAGGEGGSTGGDIGEVDAQLSEAVTAVTAVTASTVAKSVDDDTGGVVDEDAAAQTARWLTGLTDQLLSETSNETGDLHDVVHPIRA